MDKNCTWEYHWKTSGSWQGKLRDIPAKLMAAFLLAGCGYQQYMEVLHCLDIDVSSHTSFQNILHKLNSITSKMVQNKLENQKDQLLGVELIISVDAGWSKRGWSANECCISVFDAQTCNLLDMEIVLRKLNDKDTLSIFEGASSQMEAYGTDIIFRRMYDDGLIVAAIVHDGDAQILAIARKYWPNCIEYADPGHTSKNFKKNIIKLRKNYPALKNLGESVLRAFRWCLKMCEGDKNEFIRLLWNQYNHFCNISHKECTHDSNYKPKSWKWIEDHSNRQQLKHEFQIIEKKAVQLVMNFNSNLNESFNNCRTKFTDKRKNQRISFQFGCNLTALNHITRSDPSFIWKKEILELAGFQLTDNVISNFEKEDNKEMVDVNRYFFFNHGSEILFFF